jgi:hypothetical protein
MFQSQELASTSPKIFSTFTACLMAPFRVSITTGPGIRRLIEGGIPTESLIAHVLVSKYADHCPLYRQAQIYARQGIELDRSTLADWVGRAAGLLAPVQARLFEIRKSSPKLFADETRAPVLDPGRKKVKLGQLWAYARDDRPHVFACEDVQLKCTDARARL